MLQDHLQLDEHVEEVGPEALIIKLFPEVLCDLNGLVLWQFRGTSDVQK